MTASGWAYQDLFGGPWGSGTEQLWLGPGLTPASLPPSSVSTIRNQRYHIHANLSFAVLVAQVLLLVSFQFEPGTVSGPSQSCCVHRGPPSRPPLPHVTRVAPSPPGFHSELRPQPPESETVIPPGETEKMTGMGWLPCSSSFSVMKTFKALTGYGDSGLQRVTQLILIRSP